jgi:hypothetical protein
MPGLVVTDPCAPLATQQQQLASSSPPFSPATTSHGHGERTRPPILVGSRSHYYTRLLLCLLACAVVTTFRNRQGTIPPGGPGLSGPCLPACSLPPSPRLQIDLQRPTISTSCDAARNLPVPVGIHHIHRTIGGKAPKLPSRDGSIYSSSRSHQARFLWFEFKFKTGWSTLDKYSAKARGENVRGI